MVIDNIISVLEDCSIEESDLIMLGLKVIKNFKYIYIYLLI